MGIERAKTPIKRRFRVAIQAARCPRITGDHGLPPTQDARAAQRLRRPSAVSLRGQIFAGIRGCPFFFGLHLSAAYVRAGRQDDAEWEVQEIQTLSPDETLSLLSNARPVQDPALLEALLADLRSAGLPE